VTPVTKALAAGAAAGIGRATALTFAKNGYTVGGYDIDEVEVDGRRDRRSRRHGTHRTS
jgi:NAD(P)-dependent dehydrogenase (short-subunit alcohol dehydrogenase family)